MGGHQPAVLWRTCGTCMLRIAIVARIDMAALLHWYRQVEAAFTRFPAEPGHIINISGGLRYGSVVAPGLCRLPPPAAVQARSALDWS
jgi:hypothetical protein